MENQQVIDLNEWVPSATATEILSRTAGHPVSERSTRLLGFTGKVETITLGPHYKLYKRSDLESTVVNSYVRKSRADASPSTS